MQRVPLPLIGPSNKARSSAQQSGRTINLYPEINDADAKAVVALHAVPGNLVVIDISDQFGAGVPVSIRGFHTMGQRLFFVANERIYEAIDLDNNSLKLWGSLTTFSGRVGISDNNGVLIVGDGVAFYGLTLSTGVLAPIITVDGDPVLGWHSAFVDGYTLYVSRNSGTFYYSVINAPTTVDNLDFATAEGDPDNIQTVVVVNRQVLFLGARSTEFWFNSGDADNAFQRIGGGFTSHGCACRWSAAEFNGGVAYVSRDLHGEGSVVLVGGAGSTPQKISNPALDHAIANVLAERLQEQVTGFAFTEAGHRFYQLNLPATAGLANGNRKAQASMSWVCDADANLMWHERASLNLATGLLERAKADHHALWKGKHLTATYDDAAIYWQDRDFFRDNVKPLLKRRETAGPLSLGGRRFTVNRIIVEMEVAVGRDAGVQGSDPKLMMRYRWGQGAWSPVEVERSIGRIGEGKTTVEFGSCGSGRDFECRFSVSDPVRVVFTGAEAVVTVAG